MTCPHCESTATIGRSDCTELGYHRFRCHDCRRVFHERTGTPFNRLQYPTDVVCLVVCWRWRDQLSLRDLAEMFLQRGIFWTRETVRAWESKLAHQVTHRTNGYLNNHLEQDHRGVKPRYRVIGGLKTFGTAARFCRLFDEIRAFFRPQSYRNQRLTLAQRRCIHQERCAHLMGILAAA